MVNWQMMSLLLAAIVLALFTYQVWNEFKLSNWRYSVMSKVFLMGTIGLMIMGTIAVAVLAIALNI